MVEVFALFHCVSVDAPGIGPDPAGMRHANSPPRTRSGSYEEPSRHNRLLRIMVVASGILIAACTEPHRDVGPSLGTRLRVAELADAQGNSDTVFAVVRDAYLRAPSDAALRDRLVAVAARSGHQSEAAEAVRRNIPDRGYTTDGVLALCRAELQANNFDAAEAACRKVLEREPRNIAALGLLGVIQDDRGDHGGAQRFYRSGLAVVPRDWTLLSNLGLSLLLSGQAADAVAVLEPAEREAAAPRRMRHNLGLALAVTQQRERLLRLIRLDQQSTDPEATADQFFGFAKELSDKVVLNGSNPR